MKIYFNEVVEKYNIDKIFCEVLNGSLALYNKINKDMGISEDTFVAESFFPCIEVFLETHSLKNNFKYTSHKLHSLEFSDTVVDKDNELKISSVISLKSFINDYIKAKEPLEYIKGFMAIIITQQVYSVDIKYAFNDHKNTIWYTDDSLNTGLFGEVSFYNDSSVLSDVSIENTAIYPEGKSKVHRFFSIFSFLNGNDNTLKLNNRLSEYLFEGKKLTQEEINTYDLIYDANFENLNEYNDFIFPVTLNKKTNKIKNNL